MGYISRINSVGDAEGNFSMISRKLGNDGRWGLYPVGVFQLNENTQTLPVSCFIQLIIFWCVIIFWQSSRIMQPDNLLPLWIERKTSTLSKSSENMRNYQGDYLLEIPYKCILNMTFCLRKRSWFWVLEIIAFKQNQKK